MLPQLHLLPHHLPLNPLWNRPSTCNLLLGHLVQSPDKPLVVMGFLLVSLWDALFWGSSSLPSAFGSAIVVAVHDLDRRLRYIRLR